MSYTPGQLIMHAANGMGKTGMMHRILAQQAINGGLLVINSEGGLFIGGDRTPPRPHNPMHTPLEKIAEGIKRSTALLGGPKEWVFGYLHSLALELGCSCQLVRVLFQRKVDLPGKTRGRKNLHPHKIQWVERLFLRTPYGVVNEQGSTWNSLEQAIGDYSNLPKQSFGAHSVHAATRKMWDTSAGYHIASQFLRPHLSSEVQDEIALAWLEAGTPHSNALTVERRL